MIPNLQVVHAYRVLITNLTSNLLTTQLHALTEKKKRPLSRKERDTLIKLTIEDSALIVDLISSLNPADAAADAITAAIPPAPYEHH